MADLKALTPCAGLLPMTVGGLRLEEADDLSLTCVMPYKGQFAAIAQSGFVLPEPGGQVRRGNGILRWFGKDTFLSIGGALPEGVASHAAVSDVTDGWARLVLSGAEAGAVLARLVPVDTRPQALGVDRTVRTLLGHMTASVTRISAEAFEIMVFRSMAHTAVHELGEAMTHVAARGSN